MKSTPKLRSKIKVRNMDVDYSNNYTKDMYANERIYMSRGNFTSENSGSKISSQKASA